MNKQLFYGQYKRIGSYFEGIELASEGLPQGKELEILETVRGKVPGEVFTTVYANPVNGNADAVRNNRRESLRLLKEAGFDIKDQKLVNAGRQAGLGRIPQSGSEQRAAILFYKPSLERLGVNVSVRTVDTRSTRTGCAAATSTSSSRPGPQSLSPGNEQLDYLGLARRRPARLRNSAGIKNPAIDALIERGDLRQGSRRAGGRHQGARPRAAVEPLRRAAIDLWLSRATARWDRFSQPEPLPKYGISGFPTIWWWDAAKGRQDRRRV